MIEVALQDLVEKQANVPADMRVATSSGAMFFNVAKANVEPDFAKAIDAFKQAGPLISDSVPHVRILHNQLKQRSG
jgi:hypothetical protein